MAQQVGSRRSLVVSLFLTIVIAFGSLGVTLALGWGPKLGLDLAGGLSVVYKPATHATKADVTGNAEGFVGIGIDVQPRRSAVTLSDLRPLQRILLGVDFLRVLIAKRDVQSLDQIDQKHFPQDFGHSHNPHRIPPTGNGQM